jgi:hypothetical protein
MSWEDIEDGVHQAIVLASQLEAQQVLWSHQNVNEPTEDYVSMSFGGEFTIGVDRVKTTTDLTRPDGQEIKQEIKGVREVPLELQVFTTSIVGNNAARRLAEKIRTKLRLPTVRYEFQKVGLSPFDPGPVNWIPDIPRAKFRGRAACTVRCYVPVSDCMEYVGYIARVTGTVRAHGGGTSTGLSATGLSIPFDFTVG